MKKKINYSKVTRVKKGMNLSKAYLLRMPSDLYLKVKARAHKDGVTISAALLAVLVEAFE